MIMPYIRAFKATINSLKMSTTLRVVTSEFTVTAYRLCSDLVSHRQVEFSEGDPTLGRNAFACNEKHAMVFGPDQDRLIEARDGLLETYRGSLWFPAFPEEPHPALDIIEGQIPRMWTDGIFSRLEIENPLLWEWRWRLVDGEAVGSFPIGRANFPPTIIWAQTLRPSLTGYAWVGENGEYPAPEDGERRSVPVFYGSELWAKIRDLEASKEASEGGACTEEAPVIVNSSDPDDGDEE